MMSSTITCPGARGRGANTDLLRWEPPVLLAGDHGWAPGLTARGAVLWHLERFRAVAEGGAPTLKPSRRP